MNTKQLILTASLSVCIFTCSIAQSISYSKIPQDMQLFPRDLNDSSVVEISGNVNGAGADTVMIAIYRNDISWKILKQELSYSATTAPFSFSPKIFAELAEYKLEISWGNNSVYTLDKTIDQVVSGDVILINGQSNAMSNTGTNDYEDEYCRSFGVQTDWDTYNAADTLWGYARGYTLNWEEPNPFGVGAWGINLMRRLRDEFNVPLCFINGAANGSRISAHYRNDANPMDLSEIYGRLLYRATKAGVAQNVKAIIWHQGEANTDGIGPSAGYFDAFSDLKDSWYTDYPNIEKIFIFQIRQGCVGHSSHGSSELREQQRQLAVVFDDIEIMSTVGSVGYGGDLCHYTYEGYKSMAYKMYKLLAHNLYGKSFTENVSPPNLKRAYYSNFEKNQITLEFNQNIIWQDSLQIDTSTYFLRDYFYLDGVYGNVDSITIIDSNLYLDLNISSEAKSITYLPDMFYNQTSNIFVGPCLFGEDTIAALSFANVIITCQDNDYPILIEEIVDITIGSNPIGIILDTLKASDPNNDDLFYEISEGNNDSFFIIDNGTGIISLNKYPEASLYMLTSKVTDNSSCPLSTTANLYIRFTVSNEIRNTFEQNIEIFPNPNSGTFYISSSNINELEKISIFDVHGRLIHKRYALDLSKSPYPISLKNISAGLYFIRISNGINSINKKIIIQ